MCRNEEEEEDNGEEEEEEVEWYLLEHGLDPVDWLCLTSCLTNCSTSGAKFCCLQCRWKVH